MVQRRKPFERVVEVDATETKLWTVVDGGVFKLVVVVILEEVDVAVVGVGAGKISGADVSNHHSEKLLIDCCLVPVATGHICTVPLELLLWWN